VVWTYTKERLKNENIILGCDTKSNWLCNST
jgi:hypothetical protein